MRHDRCVSGAGRPAILLVLVMLLGCARGGPSGPADDAPSGDDLGALLAHAAGEPFAVAYEIQDEAGAVLGNLRLDHDPPKSAVTFDRDGTQAYSLREGDGSAVSCFDHGTGWECVRFADEDDLSPDPAAFFDDLLDGDAAESWEETRRTTQGGRDAVCGRGPALAADIKEVCVDVDRGIPLRVEEDNGTVTTAVTVAEPDTDRLEPPSEPVETGS